MVLSTVEVRFAIELVQRVPSRRYPTQTEHDMIKNPNLKGAQNQASCGGVEFGIIEGKSRQCSVRDLNPRVNPYGISDTRSPPFSPTKN